MKLIKSSVSEIIESNPYKKVELIGRTCYKSEDKITETSCYKYESCSRYSRRDALIFHRI